MNEEYDPDIIRWCLMHWQELCAAAEGGTGSLIGMSGRGGKHARSTIVAVLADLEQAADALPEQWSATYDVLRLQGRLAARPRIRRESVPLEWATRRMARSLGWSEDAPSAGSSPDSAAPAPGDPAPDACRPPSAAR